MKNAILALSLLIVTALSCKNINDKNISKTIARFGTTPRIDGILGEGEWDDAETIQLDSTKTIYLKHDNVNLYFALNGDGGNLYFLKDERIHVLHASFSLGWAEYVKGENQLWSCEKEYEWALYKLQEKSEEEIDRGVTDYLQENGWVGSIVPLGNPIQSEFAVSFEWLDISKEAEPNRLIGIPKLSIFSFQNIPPAERKGQNLRLRWPSTAAHNDSVNRGYTPETINLDVSNWGDIFIQH